MATKDINTYVAVIPAYNPGPSLIPIVSEVSSKVKQVIIIDDGSNIENKKYLAQCAPIKNVQLITFPINKGKGYALIEGLTRALQLDPDYIFTIDSDGQHDPKEIVRFKEFISATDREHDLIIGARHATNEMPLRSKIGNVFTAKLFNSLFDKSIVDSQSGFRVLSANFAKDVISNVLPGRYETEMRILIFAASSSKNIEDIKIRTIYLDNNKNSQFRPLQDSLRVLVPLAKYSVIALASFFVDYSIFLLLSYLAGVYYILSHVIARLCSGTFNFIANKHLVFKSKSKKVSEALLYVVAVFVSLAITAFMLYCLVEFGGISRALAKPLVEFLMFLINYAVLNKFVFAARN